VAKGKADFQEIQEYIKKYNIKKDQVYIMPMGTDNESQKNQEVLEFCLKN
jgi:predicted RNase H-related nuclease YkuK (DUF458 family)